jgi:hypothetical protein
MQAVLDNMPELVFSVVRGGNRTGRFGFGFGSGQFDFLEEIGSGRIKVGSIYMFCFFRSLIDFRLD